MSQSYGSYGKNPPVSNNSSLTNNPFIDTTSHPSNRYPDLSSAPTQPSQPQWNDSTGAHQQYHQDIYQQYPQIQHQQIPSGYPQTQPPFPPQQQPQIQLHHQAPRQPQIYPYQQSQSQPTGPFQPSSSFGQNLQASISGSSYGYLQSHQPQPQSQPAYIPAQQQQLLNNPNYIRQFDPLSSTSQGWSAADKITPSQSLGSLPTNKNKSNVGYSNNPNQFNSGPVLTTPSLPANNNKGNVGYVNNPNQINSGPAPVGSSSSGAAPHPRDYIRSNREKIEAWDPYTWKQLLKSCEALKKAWELKRNGLKDRLGGLQAQLKYTGHYDRRQIQLEGDRIQGLLNEAQSKFESASASTYQFDEFLKGYRQSGDTTSKKRVREATNAALQYLPKWPEP